MKLKSLARKQCCLSAVTVRVKGPDLWHSTVLVPLGLRVSWIGLAAVLWVYTWTCLYWLAIMRMQEEFCETDFAIVNLITPERYFPH